MTHDEIIILFEYLKNPAIISRSKLEDWIGRTLTSKERELVKTLEKL